MRVIWGWFAASAAVLAASAVQAQTTRTADEIRTYPPDAAVIERDGPYAAVPPPGAYEEVIPPFQAMRIARETGFEPMGRPVRQRFVYTIAAVSPEGFEGRVVLDAHTGRIMRFVPTRAEDPYGPPGGPPPFERMNARTSLRPPASVPHVASRTPAPKPDAASTARSGDTSAQQPSAQQSSPQQQAAAAPPKSSPEVVTAKPAAAAPAPAAKPSVPLQPTEAMPPVQGLD